MPGFGFSTPVPSRPDLNFWKIADLWHTLMTDALGHRTYAAAGCDVGALVTGQLGHKYADALSGIHIGSGQRLDMFNGERAWDVTGGRPIPEGLPGDVHARIIELEKRFAVHLSAQMLAPATLAHGLSDSPAGMLAWILERWSDHRGGDFESVFSKDEVLTHATIYWATNCIGSSMRLYANHNRYPWTPSHDRWPVIEAPTGPHLRRPREPARRHHCPTRPAVPRQRPRRLVPPRECDRPRSRWPLHPLGGPVRMDRRPPPHLPRPPLGFRHRCDGACGEVARKPHGTPAEIVSGVLPRSGETRHTHAAAVRVSTTTGISHSTFAWKSAMNGVISS
ncbi:hypothetical protein [Nocardia sp. NPDC059154]|uniref:hypothetical protein n=1 Tax=Nocardia sp. NPDC059154 TaxID=3346744 RepID=UPI0036BF06A4